VEFIHTRPGSALAIPSAMKAFNYKFVGVIALGLISHSASADPGRDISSTWNPRIDPELNESGQVVSTRVEDATPRALRTLNIQASPVAEIAGRYNLSIELGVFEHVSIGAKGTYFKNSNASILFNQTGSESGLRSTFYPTGRRFESGLILRAGAYYGSWQSTLPLADGLGIAIGSDFRQYDYVSGPIAEGLIGYQWVFSGGVNLDLSGGVNGYSESTRSVSLTNGAVSETKAAHLTAMPVMEFNIGVAF
jgi:hypothetical protein